VEILIALALLNLLATCLLTLFFLKHTHRPPYFGLVSPRDVILGSMVRFLNAPFTQVRLGKQEQKYHAAIFGRSGSGKSKLLQRVFLQHVSHRQGVGILEPHHDLSFDCLTSLVGAGFYKSKDAYKRVIYIDWANGVTSNRHGRRCAGFLGQTIGWEKAARSGGSGTWGRVGSGGEWT